MSFHRIQVFIILAFLSLICGSSSADYPAFSDNTTNVTVYATVGSDITIYTHTRETGLPDHNWLQKHPEQNITDDIKLFSFHGRINATDSRNRGNIVVSGILPWKKYDFIAEISPGSDKWPECGCDDGLGFYGKKSVTIGIMSTVQISQICQYETDCSFC